MKPAASTRWQLVLLCSLVWLSFGPSPARAQGGADKASFDFEALQVCGTQRRFVSQWLTSKEKPALQRAAYALSSAAAQERSNMLACMGDQLRFSAQLPDGSVLISAEVQIDANPSERGLKRKVEDPPHLKWTHCAAWIDAPSSLPYAAVYGGGEAGKVIAYFSEEDAVDVVHRANLKLLSEAAPDSDLHSATYIAVWGRRDATLYLRGREFPLGASGVAGLIAAVDAGNGQILGAFAGDEPHPVFAGLQATAGGQRPLPIELDLAGLIERLTAASVDHGEKRPRAGVQLAYLDSNHNTVHLEAAAHATNSASEHLTHIVQVLDASASSVLLSFFVLSLILAVACGAVLLKYRSKVISALLTDPSVKAEDVARSTARRRQAAVGLLAGVALSIALGLLWGVRGAADAGLLLLGLCVVTACIATMAVTARHSFVLRQESGLLVRLSDLAQLRARGELRSAARVDNAIRIQLLDGLGSAKWFRAILRVWRWPTVVSVLALTLAVALSTGVGATAAPEITRRVLDDAADRCKPEHKAGASQANSAATPLMGAAAKAKADVTHAATNAERSEGIEVRSAGDSRKAKPSNNEIAIDSAAQEPPVSGRTLRQQSTTDGRYIQKPLPYLQR